VIQSLKIDGRNEKEWRYEWGDYDWTSCRQALAQLLLHGSTDYQFAIPWDCREQVFGILKTLCTDFDPRLDEAGSAGNFERDYLTQAINSVRGEAFQAIIDHAIWIKRHFRRYGNATPDMSSMPEVQKTLEDRMDPRVESSLAVKAIIGRLTPWLYHLDPPWFARVSSTIFPVEEARREHWTAAWIAYVQYNHPDKLVYAALSGHYERAVALVGSFKQDRFGHDPVDSLGEHLIGLYWAGIIPLQESLLEKFLAAAEPKQRAHIMHHIGRALDNSAEVPADIAERLMRYWEYRLAIAKASNGREDFSEELSDFVWWFRSGKMDTKWALTQIKEFLSIAATVPETMFLTESLAEAATRYPLESLECLYELLRKRSAERYVYLNEADVKKILMVAATAHDRHIKKVAADTQDLLLRLGRFEYKDLEIA
jgi:hypothetical protein